MDRPLERRTAARTAVVWDAVRALLGRLQASSGSSTSAAAPAGSRSGSPASATGSPSSTPAPTPSPRWPGGPTRTSVADRVTGLQGDLGNLRELAPDEVDLVLCHGVLGLVDDPADALATITSVLRPGGALSLLVSQRHAAVLARAMAGHFVQAREILEGDPSAKQSTKDRGERRFTAEEVAQLLGAAGFTTSSTHGIRVFADLVPSSLLDLEPGASAALLDLERAVAARPEYLTLASQLHVLATR